jgi:hypothetical protein
MFAPCPSRGWRRDPGVALVSALFAAAAAAPLFVKRMSNGRQIEVDQKTVDSRPCVRSRAGRRRRSAEPAAQAAARAPARRAWLAAARVGGGGRIEKRGAVRRGLMLHVFQKESGRDGGECITKAVVSVWRWWAGAVAGRAGRARATSGRRSCARPRNSRAARLGYGRGSERRGFARAAGGRAARSLQEARLRRGRPWGERRRRGCGGGAGAGARIQTRLLLPEIERTGKGGRGGAFYSRSVGSSGGRGKLLRSRRGRA